MKHLFVCTGILFAATALLGQPKPLASPPETASVTIGGKTITINYNSPRVKGREGKSSPRMGSSSQTHK